MPENAIMNKSHITLLLVFNNIRITVDWWRTFGVVNNGNVSEICKRDADRPVINHWHHQMWSTRACAPFDSPKCYSKSDVTQQAFILWSCPARNIILHFVACWKLHIMVMSYEHNVNAQNMQYIFLMGFCPHIDEGLVTLNFFLDRAFLNLTVKKWWEIGPLLPKLLKKIKVAYLFSETRVERPCTINPPTHRANEWSDSCSLNDSVQLTRNILYLSARLKLH